LKQCIQQHKSKLSNYCHGTFTAVTAPASQKQKKPLQKHMTLSNPRQVCYISATVWQRVTDHQDDHRKSSVAKHAESVARHDQKTVVDAVKM